MRHIEEIFPSPVEAELAVWSLFLMVHLARVSTVIRGREDGVSFFLLPCRIIMISGCLPGAGLESNRMREERG